MPAPDSVAVILAVLNEEAHIDDCLASLVNQSLPAREIVIADGGSTDATLDMLRSWQDRYPNLITVIENPDRHQAAGLTLAARRAGAEYLVRADGHTRFAPDYLEASVAALVGGDAVAVGGSQVGDAPGGIAKAIAAAMTSPLAVGTAPYRHGTGPRPVDTVYLGAFRRRDFLEIGGFRRLPSGAAEDADLYYRWRRQGRTVLFHPEIRSAYHPRSTYRALARQFWRYGVAKADMVKLHGRLPHWRPLFPAALLLALVGALAIGLVWGLWQILAIIIGAWFTALAVVAAMVSGGPAVRIGAATAAAIMHVTYGAGLLAGLFRPAGAVARATRSF